MNMNTLVRTASRRIMKPVTLSFALGAACAFVALPAPRALAATAAAATPTAQVKQTNERLDKLLKSKKSGNESAAKQEMKSIVNGFLDYDELARRSLANHWEEITPAQRKEFVETLRELIEKNYLKQLETNLDYQVVYKGEQATADDATVSTLVKVHTKGKSTDTPIDYKMKKVGERWMVYDIVTDDVSMVKNYRQQFHKIITTDHDHFEGLLRRMRNKIDSGQGDKATASDGGTTKIAQDGKATAKSAKHK
jgi:phospholipid transport system substrate-binding protein